MQTSLSISGQENIFQHPNIQKFNVQISSVTHRLHVCLVEHAGVLVHALDLLDGAALPLPGLQLQLVRGGGGGQRDGGGHGGLLSQDNLDHVNVDGDDDDEAEGHGEGRPEDVGPPHVAADG